MLDNQNLNHQEYMDMFFPKKAAAKNIMDVSDISGAKPKRRYNSMNRVGSEVMDNTNMVAAGIKPVVKKGQESVKDVWSFGEQYHTYQAKNQSSALNTYDINGQQRTN